MTPKEKAIELNEKFMLTVAGTNGFKISFKSHALIAVDEILSLMIKFHNRHIEDNSNEIIFWELVKEEINKL
jgi:hypothetical protein